jgi:hypothetical protein
LASQFCPVSVSTKAMVTQISAIRARSTARNILAALLRLFAFRCKNSYDLRILGFAVRPEV